MPEMKLSLFSSPYPYRQSENLRLEPNPASADVASIKPSGNGERRQLPCQTTGFFVGDEVAKHHRTTLDSWEVLDSLSPRVASLESRETERRQRENKVIILVEIGGFRLIVRGKMMD